MSVVHAAVHAGVIHFSDNVLQVGERMCGVRDGPREGIYLKLNANRRSDARRILLAGNRTIAADAFW
jgi:hypothetical protein